MVDDEQLFRDTVIHLERGDFSLLDPLFADGPKNRIVAWHEAGRFTSEPKALAEALTCACFNGRTKVAEFLLAKGVDPAAGVGTGMSALHWAANRGQLEAVRLLLQWKAPLELKNMYGGTVLGCTVWSAIHEPKSDHVHIIEALIAAGAQLEPAGYPSGHPGVDEVLRRHGAKSNPPPA